MGILFWRGRVSKAEFRRQYVEALRLRMPQCMCRESSNEELLVHVSGLAGQEEIEQRLDNAYSEFRKDPGEKDEIFGRWLDALAALGNPRIVDRANILPLVKSRGWLLAAYGTAEIPPPGSENELFHDALNQDLVVCYMLMGSNFQFLTRGDLASAGIGESEASLLARVNLRARIDEPQFVDVPVGWAICVGGNFEATMLVDEDVWKDSRFTGAEALLVAVPDRNSILASTDTCVIAVWSLALMSAALARSEAYPITSKLFIRRGSGFEPLDPPIEDLEHPIPRLDVLDVCLERESGKPDLAIVIASPLGADPRSVFRLFRKFESYLDELGCHGERGKPDTEGVRRPCIYLNIHRDSHPDVLELLGNVSGFVEERGADFKLEVTE